MAGSRDQDVDRRACAMQTTAPAEKGSTHWPPSSIPWHRPLVASTPQQGGSGVQANRSASGCSPSCTRNQTRDAALPPAARGLGSACILAPGASRALC